MAQRALVLVHSPLVGVNSVLPTARAIEAKGHLAFTPSPYLDGAQPAWRDWPEALSQRLPALDRPVFVGHSMGSLLAARLAADHADAALICLDGDIPPDSGPTSPVADGFRPLLDSLPDEDGMLPPWHLWWPQGILADRKVEDTVADELVSDIPALRRDWFEDCFEMRSWGHAHKGFVKLDAWFTTECERARSHGWSVAELDAIHLYPAIEPRETAGAILACIDGMDGGTT